MDQKVIAYTMERCPSCQKNLRVVSRGVTVRHGDFVYCSASCLENYLLSKDRSSLFGRMTKPRAVVA